MAYIGEAENVLDRLLSHIANKDFWNEVDKVLSNYRERKAWLRKYGANLDI